MSVHSRETARAHRPQRYEGPVELSPELELVVQCCRWNFPGAEPHSPAARADIDWPRFLRLARFHRVQGLVWRALGESRETPPAAIAEALAGDAGRIAAASLEAALECKRLLGAFDGAGLPLLFLKGLTLGKLAYASASTKSAIDIDILIGSEDLDRSADLLHKLGYRLVVPAASDGAALRRWHRGRKESAWARPGSTIPVDFHTRLADNVRLLARLDVNSPRRLVDIGNGIALPTLTIDDQFAYLAVHGASSAWFRLKWISDFAALVGQQPAAQIVRLHRRSQTLGAGRAAGQALLLADRLFGTLDQLPGLRDEARRDGAAGRLYGAALRQLAGKPDPVEPTEIPLGTLTIHCTQFLLQSGARFKWSELVRQVRVMLP